MTLDAAVRASELLLALAFIQQALEHLAGAVRDRRWFAAQAVLAIVMAAGCWSGVTHLALLAVSVATLARFKGPYNGGSDRMRLLLLSCLAIARLSPGQQWSSIAVGYFAVQLVLSYVLAGWVKLANPDWRTGLALRDVFALSVYPVSNDLRRIASFPTLLTITSWVIILFELLFPLALASPTTLQFALALAFSFHLLNACVFGLNRFLWVWTAGYPCLFWFQGEFNWRALIETL